MIKIGLLRKCYKWDLLNIYIQNLFKICMSYSEKCSVFLTLFPKIVIELPIYQFYSLYFGQNSIVSEKNFIPLYILAHIIYFLKNFFFQFLWYEVCQFTYIIFSSFRDLGNKNNKDQVRVEYCRVPYRFFTNLVLLSPSLCLGNTYCKWISSHRDKFRS